MSICCCSCLCVCLVCKVSSSLRVYYFLFILVFVIFVFLSVCSVWVHFFLFVFLSVYSVWAYIVLSVNVAVYVSPFYPSWPYLLTFSLSSYWSCRLSLLSSCSASFPIWYVCHFPHDHITSYSSCLFSVLVVRRSPIDMCDISHMTIFHPTVLVLFVSLLFFCAFSNTFTFLGLYYSFCQCVGFCVSFMPLIT